MPEAFEMTLVLALFVAIALLSVVARKTGINSPVVMLFAGMAVTPLPFLPTMSLDPDIVLMGLLPPILYSSGVGMSWRGFRSNLRPILSMAIGCVLFTATAVATAAHFGLGMSWATAFALGAIVSPPDAVAALSMLKRMGLPRRLLTILEGESLVNDATALVLLSIALQAVTTNAFHVSDAVGKFTAIVIGEIWFGCTVGYLMLRLRRWANDSRAEILLAMVTPFLTFWPPHGLGGSGVVATVAAGMFVSWNGRAYIRSSTRLQGFFIWDLVNWCAEALTFLICGLQMRTILRGIANEGIVTMLAAGALISATVIVVRFLWVFPATYLPRLLWPPIRHRESPPSWRPPFLVGFTGLRGAVSLAAALSIPLQVNGQPFPNRDLILFITICVILATLVGQGAALPRLVRWLGLGHIGAREALSERRSERRARADAIDAVLTRLVRSEATETQIADTLRALRQYHADRMSSLQHLDGDAEVSSIARHARDLRLELLADERAVIERAYDQGRITDDARRRMEREFDLQEASLQSERVA